MISRARAVAFRIAWGTPQRAFISAGVLALGALGVGVLWPTLRDGFAWLIVASSPFALAVKTFPNEAKQVLGWAVGRLSAVSDTAEREAVRQDLEGTLSIGASRLAATTTADSILPLKIDYVRTEEEVERLPDGTLIVGVARHGNRDRNLAATAWAYVRHAVLGNARPYMDADVSAAIDFVLTKEVLTPAGPAAIREFLNTLWSPAVLGQARLRGLCEKLDELQENELLGPILIAEFADLSLSMGFRFPTEAVQQETADFVEHVYDVAHKRRGENIGDKATFSGSRIRCRVVFPSRPDIYSVKGPTGPRNAIEWAIRNAYHRVYVLGLGRDADFVGELIEPFRTDSRVLRVRRVLDVSANAERQGHATGRCTHHGRRSLSRRDRPSPDGRSGTGRRKSEVGGGGVGRASFHRRRIHLTVAFLGFGSHSGTMQATPALLTTGQVAHLLGTTVQHVVNLCARGELPYTMAGTHRRIRLDDAMALRDRVAANRGGPMTDDQLRSLWLHRAASAHVAADPEDLSVGLAKPLSDFYRVNQMACCGFVSGSKSLTGVQNPSCEQ